VEAKIKGERELQIVEHLTEIYSLLTGRKTYTGLIKLPRYQTVAHL